MLVLEHGTWKAYRWRTTLSEPGSSRSTRISKKRLDVNPDSVAELLKELTALGFWSLGQDSLNIRSMQMSDGAIRDVSITDGCSDVFELMQNGRYRSLLAYMPEAFQKEIPVKDREAFIQCKKAFFRIFKTE